MRFIGDIHGKLDKYIPIALGAKESIQVGDFGIGFRDTEGAEFDVAAARFFKENPTHTFIRGNHDNPDQCRHLPAWIHDGYFDPRGIMFIGGGLSIDQSDRIEGISWWRDEQLSVKQFIDIMDDYEIRKPKVMVTHDAPEDIAREMFFGPGFMAKSQNSTVTGQALSAMLEIHQPDFWIFGHWHMKMLHKSTRYNTQFICLGELDHIDINI